MTFRNFIAAGLVGIVASLVPAAPAQATGDVWVEGSYERLALPNVQFVDSYHYPTRTGAPTALVVQDGTVRQEFTNHDGDFNGFRIDGGVADIPVMNGAYLLSLSGFFAWHDSRQELQCIGGDVPGDLCLVASLIDDPSVIQSVGGATLGAANLFATERDVHHWGLKAELAQGPNGIKFGPAFRRIDQTITITGQEELSGTLFGAGGTVDFPDAYQLVYRESLETNYWGAFIGLDQALPLGAGWTLISEGEAGLYWAHTEFSGNYSVNNARNNCCFGNPFPPDNRNVTQVLSLASDELAFIGTLKAALERDFGLFKLAGFGRVEYISSAPDIGYNDKDVAPGVPGLRGGDDKTSIGDRFAYSISTGARITVPFGGQ